MKTAKKVSKLSLLKSWVKALRNGRYEQCTGGLCQIGDANEKSYCCLGVACEVYSKRVEKLTKTFTEDGWIRYNTTQDFLPSKVARAFGLSSIEQKKLSDMNDWKSASFDKIADYIETNIISKVKK